MSRKRNAITFTFIPTPDPESGLRLATLFDSLLSSPDNPEDQGSGSGTGSDHCESSDDAENMVFQDLTDNLVPGNEYGEMA